jgi:predicted nucleic acid-binding protein
LTGDNPEHSPRAAALFRSLEAGQRTVVVPEAVVAEIVFVLASRNLYDRPREFIRERLGYLLRLPSIEVASKGVCIEALDTYAESPRLSFLDSLCLAHAKRLSDATVITFDRGYRNIEGVTPVAP